MDYYVLDKENLLEPIGMCSDLDLMKILKITKNKLHSIVENQKELNNRYILVEAEFSDDLRINDKLFDENEIFSWYVQEDGKIFCINKKTRKKKYLVPRVDGRGELKITINKKTSSVKNIVAKAFLDDWYEDCMVVIKNDDKRDVKVSNLRVCSRKQWFTYLQNKRMKKRVGKFVGDKLVKEWDSITECARELYFEKSCLRKMLQENKADKIGIRYL